jgi:hypothetical protein
VQFHFTHIGKRAALVALVIAALVLAGCGSDAAGVDAAAEILPAADLRFADDQSRLPENESLGSATQVLAEGDSFGAFSLLAPSLSGVGLETYSTSCDPFEDPYGACL